MAFCYSIHFGSNEMIGCVRNYARGMIVLEVLKFEIWEMWKLGVVERVSK